MATFVSDLYTGWVIHEPNHLLSTLTGNISRNGTTVSLTNMTLTTKLNLTGYYTSVYYSSDIAKSWALLGPNQQAIAVPSVTYRKGTYYNGNTLFSVSVPNASFTLSNASATTATLYIQSPDGNFAFTLGGIPSAESAPTGLAISNITPYDDYISATVSITGWGNGGTESARYRELNVSSNGTEALRRFQKTTGSTLSSTISVNNNSEVMGGMNIVPNTQYYLWVYATNGSLTTSTPRTGASTVTKPAAVNTVSASNIKDTTATIDFTTSADGGKYDKTIQYSINGGAWQNGPTLTGGGAKSSSFTVSGLTPETQNSLSIRVNTTAGESGVKNIAFTTEASSKFYGSVNGKTKRIVKLYGSVNGKTKLIKKLYGSVNGKTKRII